VHVPSEDKSGYPKTVYTRNWSKGFYYSPKYHMNILLGDFNVKVGRENTFKPIIGNESLNQDSNYNGVRIANFATYKNLVDKSTMFQHRNFHKYNWTSPDGQIHNQTDHRLIRQEMAFEHTGCTKFQGR
jgi:hypothetical protein